MKKYLIDGQMVNVVERTPSGYIVQHYYADYDEFDYSQESECPEYYLDDKKVFANQVFDNPPTQALSREVQELKTEITELEKLKTELVNNIGDTNREVLKRLEKLKKYDQLKYIEDFLDEKITHFVVVGWCGTPEIKTFEEKTKYKDGYEFETRLLCLYGNKKKVQWRLHYYSDSSGNSETVYPFTSYELARDKVHEILREKFETLEAGKKSGKRQHVSDAIKAAKKYKFPAPEWAEEEAEKEKEKDRKLKSKELEAEKAIIEAKIKELQEVT